MKLRFVLFALLLASSGGLARAASSPMPVYDVTTYGASPLYTDCAVTTDSIQHAIWDASHGGGIVYFPPGKFCISDELVLYPYVTLLGSSAAGIANQGGYGSILHTSTSWPTGKAVVRMADRNVPNYGPELRNLTIYLNDDTPGAVGVDWSGAWYGSIHGVAVIGRLTANPRAVASVGSVGFIFSDKDGASLGAGACFSNLVDRVSVSQVDIGMRFQSTRGNAGLQSVTNFWMSDVKTAFEFSSVGSYGISLRDGYMSTSLDTPGRKAFVAFGSSGINIEGTTWEGFDAEPDLLIKTGDTFFGGSIVRSDAGLAFGQFTPVLSPAQGSNCGSVSSCPCRPRKMPPPGSTSFWASIPIRTDLVSGANTFTYYTAYHSQSAAVVPDLFFAFHPSSLANIAQPFTLTAKQRVSTPQFYSTPFLTYDVTLWLTSPVSLTADFVFLLEANFTEPSRAPGTCTL